MRLHEERMADVDPLKLLEPAATRVRDPVTGRSVWLAQMIRHPQVRGETLHFDLVFDAGHSPFASRPGPLAELFLKWA